MVAARRVRNIINVKMRNITLVALSTTLVLLIVVPQIAQCSVAQVAMSVAKVAMTVLTSKVKSYMSDLRLKREAETISIRVWMHRGDRKMNGCGFYIQANGYAGGFGSGFFPPKKLHRCDGTSTTYYEMRMTSQSAMYNGKVHLGNEQCEKFEIHADGWHNTFINVLCIGFNERTIPGGPRGFCINNELLKACKDIGNKWNDIDINYNDIIMTRTSRGIHKLVFHDIEEIISSYEKFDRNPNDSKAIRKICNRIDLVKGRDRSNNWTCAAQKQFLEATGAFDYAGAYAQRIYSVNKNPYGCKRYTD